MKRHIDILNRSSKVDFDKARLGRFISKLDELLPGHCRAPEGELSIVLVDDAEMKMLHERFLGDPSSTDVITFEGDGECAGEICAGAERALMCAGKFGNTPSRELCLYVAHGYLHLAGIDDISASDAAEMRACESLALEILDRNFRKDIFKYKNA